METLANVSNVESIKYLPETCEKSVKSERNVENVCRLKNVQCVTNIVRILCVKNMMYLSVTCNVQYDTYVTCNTRE